MIIDANVYWFPEEVFTQEALLQKFMADIPRAYGTVGTLREAEGAREIVIERPAGCPGVNYRQGEYALPALLAAMDRAGIDKAVLKVPCCHEWMGLEMCRLFNDGMADYARRSRGRLIPLAVVPPFAGQAALEELARCRDQLGMRGIQMSAHYGALYLDDAAFAPLLERLNEYGMTVYVHHTPVPVECTALLDYNNLRRSYGRCEDQVIAVCRELMSGMFKKYPSVRVVHSMLGGGFFTYLNMLVPPLQGGTDSVRRFDDNGAELRGYLQSNVFFETSHAQPWGSAQLTCAIRVLGADHVVYGSSYPVREEWLSGGPAFVRALDLTGAEKDAVLCKNAQSLYHID